MTTKPSIHFNPPSGVFHVAAQCCADFLEQRSGDRTVETKQDILVAEGLREPIGADSEARMLPRDVQVMLPAPVPESAQPSVTDWLRDNGFLPEENSHAE